MQKSTGTGCACTSVGTYVRADETDGTCKPRVYNAVLSRKNLRFRLSCYQACFGCRCTGTSSLRAANRRRRLHGPCPCCLCRSCRDTLHLLRFGTTVSYSTCERNHRDSSKPMSRSAIRLKPLDPLHHIADALGCGRTFHFRRKSGSWPFPSLPGCSSNRVYPLSVQACEDLVVMQMVRWDIKVTSCATGNQESRRFQTVRVPEREDKHRRFLYFIVQT